VSYAGRIMTQPNDAPTSDDVRRVLRDFVSERDWDQFHAPANLAKSVVIEAAELLECFQWSDDGDPDDYLPELGDVLTYCFLLADKAGVDPHALIIDKLAETRAKYPVEKSFGTSTKYDGL
jgi:dCTP diphosphatase